MSAPHDINRQHRNVQDQDRPQEVEIAIADEGWVARDSDRPQRGHPLRAKRGEDQGGRKISSGIRKHHLHDLAARRPSVVRLSIPSDGTVSVSMMPLSGGSTLPSTQAVNSRRKHFEKFPRRLCRRHAYCASTASLEPRCAGGDCLCHSRQGSATAATASPNADKRLVERPGELIERALALDPKSVDAQSLLAEALVARVTNGLTGSAVADLLRAETLVDTALAASPRNGHAILLKVAYCVHRTDGRRPFPNTRWRSH